VFTYLSPLSIGSYEGDKMHAASLRLFNAIQVRKREPLAVPRGVLERTIKNGYILDPAIEPSPDLLNTIEGIVGISGEKASATFHKSWAVVRDSPIEVLVLQQIFHYITTYGFEALGVYSEDTVYIPREALELPDIQENIPLIVIKAMTAGELLDVTVGLGSSGVALMQETLDDIMAIIEANEYDPAFIAKITNRELKTLLLDFYHVVPDEPVEYLRWLISKLTGESLLIKNDYLISKIKDANGKFLDLLLEDAPDDLASIFLRYKPLFLALKSISKAKRGFFNRLRKDARKMHKPLTPDYLNSITAQIKRGELDLTTLKRRLETAIVWRKARLACALQFRLNAGNSTIYRVRNGRGWATDFEWPADKAETVQAVLALVLASIANDIRLNVEGKTIYIPADVGYALPATEKQFTGHFPNGSYVAVPEDMIVGVHWTNTENRVDLDLSVISASGKVGWDSSYRTSSRDVLFSGDLTDAPKPNGASELFYLQAGQTQANVVMLNYYNFSGGDQVEAKVLVAHDKPDVFDKNYVVDASNIIASANVNIAQKQSVLGLIICVNAKNRFYFANASIGNSITSSSGEQSGHARSFLVDSLVNSVGLGAILTAAGAHVVNEKPGGEYLNLAPEALDKTTILNLLGGGNE